MTNQSKDPRRIASKQKWLKNNPEKRKQIALSYAQRKKAENPEAYLELMRQRARIYRLKDPQKFRDRFKRWKAKQDKETINRKHREYMRRNPEKVRLYNRNRKEKHKIYSRKKWLEQYGLTEEMVSQMLIKQEGKCAICGTLFGDTKPNIDHCHKQGMVRGLLCSPCNIVLGYVEKIRDVNPIFSFESFTEYLKH
jgi:hypothetical protein